MKLSKNQEIKIHSDKLKNSANIYDSSGSKFFKTNTGTQRKPETSE